MTWRYAEFKTGNGARTPLMKLVSRPGPAGCVETTYSWDHGNAHFVVLNEYWKRRHRGGQRHRHRWRHPARLAAMARARSRSQHQAVCLRVGHEPAFPQQRHLDNSLNKYPDHRDAFWTVLKHYHVQAFISGHVHYYYKDLRDDVWQVSDGNAGKSSEEKHQNYLDVVVGRRRPKSRSGKTRPTVRLHGSSRRRSR